MDQFKEIVQLAIVACMVSVDIIMKSPPLSILVSFLSGVGVGQFVSWLIRK